VDGRRGSYGVAPYVKRENLHIREHGLYTPRDFDVSPFFEVVKPTIEAGFDFRHWPADRRRSFILSWVSHSPERVRRTLEAGARALRPRRKRPLAEERNPPSPPSPGG
jgi:hypothetical protein